MTIDDIEQWARQNNYTIVADNWWEAAQDRINKYQQLQADYENRLKADMVAMLTELLLETEEMDCEIDHDFEGYYNGVVACQKRIQQKINELKGDQEGKE